NRNAEGRRDVPRASRNPDSPSVESTPVSDRREDASADPADSPSDDRADQENRDSELKRKEASHPVTTDESDPPVPGSVPPALAAHPVQQSSTESAHSEDPPSNFDASCSSGAPMDSRTGQLPGPGVGIALPSSSGTPSGSASAAVA